MAEWFADLQGDTREAARRLFSNLGHLESIAVLACEKGFGVEGQHEDELRHRRLFFHVAQSLGGVEHAPASIEALTSFLDRLRGPESVAALNIVGEAWLGNVFEFIGPRGPWADLFTEITEDEARHVRLARLEPPKLHPSDVRPLVACLEELLWDITVDPFFAWPMAWFTGLGEMGKLGERAKRAHAESCAALGVEPGFHAERIAQCGRRLEEFVDPRPVALTASQRTFFAIDMPAIRLSFEARWRHAKRFSDVEAIVARAVGSALSVNPRLNRTVVDARQEVWQPARPIVGVRRKAGDEIVTVFVRDPQRFEVGELKHRIHSENTAMLGLRPTALPVLPEPLARLQPPSRVAATVTNVTAWTPRGGVGVAPLAPREGATFSVCITSLYRRWGCWFLTITIDADHRAHNGEELARLGRAIQDKLEGR